MTVDHSGKRTYLFTSESVNEGHPDKLADRVSDTVLDAVLAADPNGKVACETATKTNMIMIFGESIASLSHPIAVHVSDVINEQSRPPPS